MTAISQGDIQMRFFARLLRLAALAVCLTAGTAAAQTAGKDYLPVQPPQPTESGNKIEVIEFFWYGCPHCNSLQPSLKTWLKRKPADVEFKRIPAVFQESWVQLARTYYALEAMGLVDKLHHEIFAAIHEQRTLDPRTLAKDPKPLFDWVGTKGVDQKKFTDTYNSFAVQSRTQRSIELTRVYDVPGTPALVIDGRYLTAPSMTLRPDNSVDYERFFHVVDQLIATARKSPAAKAK
jgi:thiol:disulfide interchange protein DsbA